MGLCMDLVFTTKELSRVLTEPTTEANQILARTLQYVEQTKNAYETDTYCVTDGITNDDDIPIKHGYHYSHAPPLILTCLTDIDLGGQLPTRQSTSGYLLYLNGQLFH